MRVSKLPATLALSALLLGGASLSALASVLVEVDKGAQRMTVSVDGKERYTWPVSTGKSGYNTPDGSFTAFRMEEDHLSKEWDDAPMPHSIFFTREGHAIHGSFDTRHLGKPVSHGCVRISPANAATLFALVKAEGLTKTKVVITGAEPEPALVAKRDAGKSRRSARNAADSDGLVPVGADAEERALDSYASRMRRQYRDDRAAAAQAPAYAERVVRVPAYEDRVVRAPAYAEDAYAPRYATPHYGQHYYLGADGYRYGTAWD